MEIKINGAGEGARHEILSKYTAALAEYNKLGVEGRDQVMGNFTRLRSAFLKAKKDMRQEKIVEMFKANEGRIPPDVLITSEEDKGYFVIAVEKFLKDEKEKEYAEIKRGYHDPLPGEDIRV